MRKQWFEKMDNDFDANLLQLRKENEAMRAEIEGHRKAQAAVYFAIGTDESNRDKWPELIEQLRRDLEKKNAKIAVMREAIEAFQNGQMMVANAAARKAAGLED